MEENKKIELTDDALEEVSGGVIRYSTYGGFSVGDRVRKTRSPRCSRCGAKCDTGVIYEILGGGDSTGIMMVYVKVDMDCCSMVAYNETIESEGLVRI